MSNQTAAKKIDSLPAVVGSVFVGLISMVALYVPAYLITIWLMSLVIQMPILNALFRAIGGVISEWTPIVLSTWLSTFCTHAIISKICKENEYDILVSRRITGFTIVGAWALFTLVRLFMVGEIDLSIGPIIAGGVLAL